MGYKNQVIRGASWLGLFRFSSRGLSFLRTAILARLLTPSQFGFFAVASLVLSLTELITETGINIVLVQKKESIDHYINTAWLTSIVRGLLISSIIIISIPFVTSFFKMPEATSLLVLISIVPIIRGFINPSKVKLVKDLRFRDEFFYNLGMFFVEFLVTITSAFYTHSPVSLVYGLIAGALYDVIFSFIVFKPTPKIVFEKMRFLEIIHVGKWLTATGLLSYLYQNIDNIVIGRMLGATSLGLYDVSYKISLLPLTEVTDVIGKASFPVFVKINEDLNRLKRAYLLSVSAIFTISICIALILILFPSQIILILLGENWLAAAPVLQVLSILGVLRAVFISVVHPLYAIHKQKIVTYLSLLSVIILLIIIIPFVSLWGIVGAAIAAIIGTIIPLPIAIYLVLRELKTSHAK